MAPLDPIIGLNEQFQRDDYPQKVIVGVGAYRDDVGKPYVLPCVREAEQKMMDQKLDMEYSGIVSLSSCTQLFAPPSLEKKQL
jgi:aspartate aminotransferase